MIKIKCSNIKCAFRNWESGECMCSNINLVFSSIATVNQGQKDILECKSFELDNEYKRLQEKLKEVMPDELKKFVN